MSVAHGTAFPPRWPVVVQGAVVAAAAALAWHVTVNDGPWPLALAGYVMGAVIAVFLLALYRSLSSSRRSKDFRNNPTLDRAVQLLAVVGLFVGLYCGYLLATEIAKW